VNSLFGRFSWGLRGIENKLMQLLELGSHMVFPVAEILIMNIWRILNETFYLYEDDTEKISLVSEALKNAFYAIRSLIHLGSAWRKANEPSDSEYTGEDSKSQLDR